MAEIRQATAQEMDEYAYVCAAGLGIPRERVGTTHPEQSLCAFEDGKIVSTFRAIPYTVHMNGKDAPASGIADVSTLPTHRRRGYQRALFSHHLSLLHEGGEESIIILWPSRGGIYRRYGCEFVTMQLNYRIEPGYLQFADPPVVTGSFMEIGEEQLDIAADLYRRFAAGRTGYLHRSSEWWRKQVVEREKNPLSVRLIYMEAGKPTGYLMYEVEPVRGGIFHHEQRLIVTELVYLNMSAFYSIWRYFAGLDLTASIVLPNVAQDDPLPYLLIEPRALVRMETESSTSALMGRIVDVERALRRRGYQAEGRLSFEVQDQLCPWNGGRWEIEVSGGEAVVKRSRKSPQVAMPIDTLAALTFNYMNASLAARIGKLDVLEPGAAAVWDTVMNTAFKPLCPDHF